MRLTRAMLPTFAIAIFAVSGLTVLFTSKGDGEPATEPAVDVHMRTPAEELASIQLPPGYHLELVAADPDIICPVLCEWDGDGRMYVAEMRSYMLDINGARAHTPISRVSRWEQTGGDGVYDKHTVYADKLLLPRMVLPLDERTLIRETDTKDIWCYLDTTGAGTADQKQKIYEGGRQEGNLEHQPSGLMWDIDNWIYVTAQNERFRFTRGKIEKQALPGRPGQWGIAMTDTGGLIYNRAGSEQSAYDFQTMPEYGELSLPDERARGFDAVYPIENLTDVEGGVMRLWPQGGVNHFTGCAGGSIYRGDALPADLRGDYILPEPVGRLIRRAKVTQVDGKIIISNAYDHKEFIASTDPNFRPVWTATGPDGFLYICDLYHGIIQEANWTKEGSYLRPQIKKYGLQKNIDRGRIWRLVYDGATAHVQPRMLEETPAQLVGHLSDRNGWWRDTAQKLIILRGDKSVVPALEDLARTAPEPITRLHATWTLDGMDSLSAELLLEKLKDADPRLRSAAVRMAEQMIVKMNQPVTDAVKALATDIDPSVAAQACLSLLFIKHPDAEATAATAIATPRSGAGTENVKLLVDRYHQAVARAAAEKAKEEGLKKQDAAKGELFAKGRDYYGQTCIACHGADGMGTPTPEHNGITLAPPLKGSRKLLADRQLVARIVLHGLVGPNNGTTYPGQMAGFKYLNDDWLAAVLTYARNDWGNTASAIQPADISDVRKLTNDRAAPFTVAELYSAVESTAPVTPHGAKTAPQPGEIVLDPTTVQMHGEGIHIDCYDSGLDIGYWENWQDWVSWTLPAQAAPGDYEVFARTACPDKSCRFSVHIAGQELNGATPLTKAWDDYRNVDLGVVHIKKAADVPVEFRPADAEHWGPTNLSAIKLVPTTQPADDKSDEAAGH